MRKIAKQKISVDQPYYHDALEYAEQQQMSHDDLFAELRLSTDAP